MLAGAVALVAAIALASLTLGSVADAGRSPSPAPSRAADAHLDSTATDVSAPTASASPSLPAATPSATATATPSAAPSPTPSATPSPSAAPLSNVIVRAFSVADDMSTARVTLANPDDVGFTGPEGSLEVASDGTLTIPLTFVNTKDLQHVEISVASSPPAVIRIEYYSAAYYKSVGVDSKGVIILFTTLPRSDNKATPEPLSKPTSGSLIVDKAIWAKIRTTAGLLPATAPVEDQILKLYQEFDQLKGAGAQCATNLSGDRVFYNLAAGRCSAWCAGYARMTRDFLRSARVPARYISLAGSYRYLPNGVLVESSESHVTSDMWVNGTWQWLDGTFRVLKATGPDGKVLTLEGLIKGLSDGITREQISFTRLDSAGGTWQTLPYAQEDDQFKTDLASFLSGDKRMVVGNGGAG